MPGLGDRYYVRKLTSADKTKVEYAIEDISDGEYVRDERRNPGTGKRMRHRFWRSTVEDDAIHYAALLNESNQATGEHAATMLANLSKTQRISYANANSQRNNRSGRRVRAVASESLREAANAFRRCDACKRTVRADHTC